MKRRHALLLASSLWSIDAWADPAGEAVLDRLDAGNQSETAASVVRQTITTTGGDDRTFVLSMDSGDKGDVLLVRYREPKRVRGLAFLMLNDRQDTWTYSPKTKRTRRLTSSTKKRQVNGSDFTYEDFGSGSGTMGEDFDATWEGEEDVEGALCDRVACIPRDKDSSYTKVIIWVRRDVPALVRADYFDEAADPVKRFTASDIRVVGDISTPHTMRMRSLRKNRETLMEVLEMNYDVEYPAGFFSLDQLRSP